MLALGIKSGLAPGFWAGLWLAGPLPARLPARSKGHFHCETCWALIRMKQKNGFWSKKFENNKNLPAVESRDLTKLQLLPWNSSNKKKPVKYRLQDSIKVVCWFHQSFGMCPVTQVKLMEIWYSIGFWCLSSIKILNLPRSNNPFPCPSDSWTPNFVCMFQGILSPSLTSLELVVLIKRPFF